ncbi:probable histone-lysine N-methyltransferase CG1716 [Uranotaenia lowii]|uniref:probable histone-lysine N-methyltransferase CG1716 n=1 Tax=Uranotaenia lowii TaxID=190385 RepID=UPI002479C2A3|nr:probable histone-lysine N-methyltransferase CG1716 [Uranotaenia lowii]
MVRNTRTSAAVKNSNPSPSIVKEDEKSETPPLPTTTKAAAAPSSPKGSGASSGDDGKEGTGDRETAASCSPGPSGENIAFGPNVAVLVEKLDMSAQSPVASPATARKSVRGKPRPVQPARVTRTSQRFASTHGSAFGAENSDTSDSSQTAAPRMEEDDNEKVVEDDSPRTMESSPVTISSSSSDRGGADDGAGMIEVIEVIEEDSKSQDAVVSIASSSTPQTMEVDSCGGDGGEVKEEVVEAENPVEKKVTAKGGPKRNGRKSKGKLEPMNVAVDEVALSESTQEGMIQESAVVSLDEKISEETKRSSEEEDASSTVSSGAASVQPVGNLDVDLSSKTDPPSATRKSKRQVKVTNKYKDFVVDAPLPSSQVPYADVKLARANSGGGRKSLPLKTETEVAISSIDDMSPDSPPMALQTPTKTYSGKKKKQESPTKVETPEKPKRRGRAATPVPRTRKKKETKTAAVDDKEVLVDESLHSRNDSTICLNIDSSYFSDDDIFQQRSPSPLGFCGYSDDEYNDPGAGPSLAFFRLTEFISDPSMSTVSRITAEKNVEVKERTQSETDLSVKKRGRNSKKTAPIAVESDKKQMHSKEKAEEDCLELEVGDETGEVGDVMEDSMEIVLQADEIILDDTPLEVLPPEEPKPPRNRRRIRGGKRISPSDGPLRRGRSKRDTASEQETESIELAEEVEKLAEPVASQQPMEVGEIVADTVGEKDEPFVGSILIEESKKTERKLSVSLSKSRAFEQEKLMKTPTKKKDEIESVRDSSLESNRSDSKSRKSKHDKTPSKVEVKDPGKLESNLSIPVVIDQTDPAGKSIEVKEHTRIKDSEPPEALQPVIKTEVEKTVKVPLKEEPSKELKKSKERRDSSHHRHKEHKKSKEHHSSSRDREKDRERERDKSRSDRKESSSKQSSSKDREREKEKDHRHHRERKEKHSSDSSSRKEKRSTDGSLDKKSKESTGDRRSDLKTSEKKLVESIKKELTKHDDSTATPVKNESSKSIEDTNATLKREVSSSPSVSTKKEISKTSVDSNLICKTEIPKPPIDPTVVTKKEFSKPLSDSTSKNEPIKSATEKDTTKSPASKKCFDSELQALDTTKKVIGMGTDDSKRHSLKDADKSRRSEKHKPADSKKKSTSTADSKSTDKADNRSTDVSPHSRKHSSSGSSKKVKESKDSEKSSKARKSLSSSLKDIKPSNEVGKVKGDQPLEIIEKTDVEAIKPVVGGDIVKIKDETYDESKSTAPPVDQEDNQATESLNPMPTKASRKMYQSSEEIIIPSSSSQETCSSQASLKGLSEMECDAPPEVKPEPEVELEKMSEAFDNSVKISGPRPEVALKEFENISLSEESASVKQEQVPSALEQKPDVQEQKPNVEELERRESISPPTTQEDDSNSNNSVNMSLPSDTKGSELDDSSIRRSTRIKTISSQKQKTSGHGLVKDRDKFLKKTTFSLGFDSKVLKDAVTGSFNVITTGEYCAGMDLAGVGDSQVTNIELSEEYLRDMEEKLSRFETIKENLYMCERITSKEAKKMTCDCFLTQEEIERGELGCGEDCLNKLLMIECGQRCVVGDRCTNKRIQKAEYANCQVFRTEKKGFGVQASIAIPPGEFIMEYVGEVLNSEQFEDRAEIYSKEKNKHYYFMALRSDAIIDATTKGNISRFINHSCDPNAETQKWTVNGELRIGFFSTKYILPGEEITFDYQFQRYGRKAQKCYCEADNCTGWIGGDPGSDGESEYEEEEVEESEEEDEKPAIDAETTVSTIPLEITTEESAVSTSPATIKQEGEADIKPATTPLIKPHEPKPKKIRKRIERTKTPRMRIIEDPDLEKEINNLLRTGLKNQAHTLKLSRLMVRAKDIRSRSRLLTILQSGELPCRRLFLDYHGLRLLYGWICESTESIEDLKFRIQILDTLDRLPITNKTMLKDSKILQTIEKWSKMDKKQEKEPGKEKEKETSSTSSPSDEAGSDSNTSSSDAKKQEPVENADVLKNMPELLKLADLGELKEIISSTSLDKEGEKEKPVEAAPSAITLIDSIEIPETEDENAPEEKRLGTQIRILSCKLLISWVNLKEIFRIPKKERIEQMKEHEREADLRYKALGLGDEDQWSHRHQSSRLPDRSREFKRRKSMDDRDLLNYHKTKRLPPSSTITASKMDHLSKQQRRQLFEMQVAHEEAERRNKELWLKHENNCMKFGLNPHTTNPMDVPAKMNPATGEYFSADDRLLPTPPSHVYFKVLPPPMPTNPDDYELPPMDLPPLWKFAIDDRGRLYYYHVRDRVPQWEPPRKDLCRPPGQHGIRDEDISMSSDSSTTDTEDSEEEHLNTQVEALLKRKKKQQSSFNLDDVLAKPDDLNDDLSKTIKDLDGVDSSPQASSSTEKLQGELLERTAEELLQHRKRKHSNKLVQEKIISPRTEEDKLYGQMEMKRYKETKEKLRRRKEEAKRLRARSLLDKSLSESPFTSTSFSVDVLDKSAAESSLIDDDLVVVSHKIVDDKCIVDELDILTKKKKISPYEEWQKVKQRLGKKRAAAKMGESSSYSGSPVSSGSLSASKVGKRKKTDKFDLSSDEARKIKEKFRTEIAGVIVQHLGAYRKESCQSGRITTNDDFKHLARKLTHFVLLKELKHCDNTVNELEVTDSVRNKAREFIKKYMAKHGSVYVRGENEPDYASINL